jgi:hypothetical protein
VIPSPAAAASQHKPKTPKNFAAAADLSDPPPKNPTQKSLKIKPPLPLIFLDLPLPQPKTPQQKFKPPPLIDLDPPPLIDLDPPPPSTTTPS